MKYYFGQYPPSSIPANSQYLCSDYKDDGNNILLDANENAYGPGLAPHSFVSNNNNGVIINGTKKEDTAEELSGINIILGLNRYPDP